MDAYQITFSSWNQVAQAYQDVLGEVDLYNSTYDAFLELLPNPEADLLEIGCGPGNITRYVLAKKQALHITCIDVAPSMLALARQNNPRAEFIEMDARNLHHLQGPYDAILCGFCIPYLSAADCEKLFRDCARLLKTGGVLCVSAIEGNYEDSGFLIGRDGVTKMYVYYHEAAFLHNALQTAGFTILTTTRLTYERATGAEVHLVVMVRLDA